MKPEIKLKTNQTILFIGDSITDADRLLPAYQPFGAGYVHFTAYHLLAKYPQLNLNIINTGISGNTIEDLKLRWQKDCLSHSPDIVSILIGVNDLWRQHDEAIGDNEAVLPDEFESIYTKLLEQIKQQCNSQIILVEPFMFCADPQDMMYKGLGAYIDITANLAKKFDATLVPLKSQVEKVLETVPAEKWSDDMVHPYIWAHAWISQRWLEATKL